MLDLIDQMRVAIPEEVKKAQQLLAQRDRLMAQAQEEANRTIAIAREKSEQLVERDAIVQAARSQADQIIAQSHVEGDRTRQEADEYVMETLAHLEMEMERLLNQVRNGIRTLQNELPLAPEAQTVEPPSALHLTEGGFLMENHNNA